MPALNSPSGRPGRPRPLVLISRWEEVAGERWDDYAECIRAAGAEARAIDRPPDAPAEQRGLPPCDGLVLTAGVDIDPARYGQARSERVREVDPARDAWEERLLADALARDIPVLAICRGSQLFNTARGGWLLQHLEEREPHRARRGPDGESIASGWHDVDVAAGSLLARVTGATRLHVNSRHHQAVLRDGVAPGLRATAVAPDGVVEALEDPERRWALAVQWHPERPEMTERPELAAGSVRLFEAFVAACAAGAGAQAVGEAARGDE